MEWLLTHQAPISFSSNFEHFHSISTVLPQARERRDWISMDLGAILVLWEAWSPEGREGEVEGCLFSV